MSLRPFRLRPLPAAAVPNRLAAALAPGDVLVDLDVATQHQAFERAGLLFEAGHGLARSLVTDRLQERERLGSTALGHGVAFPHARIKGLKDAVAAVMQLHRGIDFHAPDSEPVRLLFFLFVPEASTQQHLDILAEIAEMLSDRGVREAMSNATDAAVLHATIVAWRRLGQA